MSHVPWHMSRTMCHLFLYFDFLWQSVGASWWRVSYQWGLACLFFPHIHKDQFMKKLDGVAPLITDSTQTSFTRTEISVRVAVCLSVCPSAHFWGTVLTSFGLNSRSRMSKVFGDSESLGKNNGKKWSQIGKLLLIKGVIYIYIYIYSSGETSRWRVCYQRGYPV